ncbi:hypothetical protein ABCS02_15140 [Microbacterium sp. X-17]|uniref:hypothetical protein n=1 Tax=Microbacterium sp. X-17 TaxID=3144404 RepID=UPI0031F5D81F
MSESTNVGRDENELAYVAHTAPTRPKRGLSVVLVAFVAAIFAIGVTAPPANAAEAGEPSYELTVGGETITFAEGETVTVGMERIAPDESGAGILSRAVFNGNAGTLTVTGSNGAFRYGIAMSIPVTTFVGVFTVTDISHGGSGGRTPVLGFSGSVPTSNLRGHTYSGVLEGTAFLLGAAAAKTMPNYTTFKN